MCERDVVWMCEGDVMMWMCEGDGCVRGMWCGCVRGM